MLIDEYQRQTSKTAIYPREFGLSYTALGLSSEAGEVAGKIKKVIRDNRGVVSEEKRAELIKELGDVMWYTAQVASVLNVSLSVVAQANLDKLQARKKNNTIQGSGDNR